MIQCNICRKKIEKNRYDYDVKGVWIYDNNMKKFGEEWDYFKYDKSIMIKLCETCYTRLRHVFNMKVISYFEGNYLLSRLLIFHAPNKFYLGKTKLTLDEIWREGV